MTRIRASWRYRCPLPVEGAQENERLRRVLAVDRPFGSLGCLPSYPRAAQPLHKWPSGALIRQYRTRAERLAQS